MYALRTVNKRSTRNKCIGKDYQTIERHYQDEEFRKVFEQCFGRKHSADLDPESDIDSKEVIQFVVTGDGEIIPIRSSETVFVVSESGRTYECLNRAKKN